MKNGRDKRKKRNQHKHPGLIKGLTSRVRQEYHDVDEYIDQLNEEELAWLNKFMEEELNASFKNDGTDLNKTKEERKKIYDRNNARNRCQYGIIKAKVAQTKLLNYENVLNIVEQEVNDKAQAQATPIEDVYVDFLESKQIEQFLIDYDNAMLLFREEIE